MKQIDAANAYFVTDKLIQQKNLSIQGKWILYTLRKELNPAYEFYKKESRDLFNQYDTTADGNVINFKSPELAADYKKKQEDIDNLEIDNLEKKTLKLSDIPDITVEEIELLEKFIEFTPE